MECRRNLKHIREGGRVRVLVLNNVKVIYDRVILVLNGLSLSVPDGKVVALLGASGAGKTSALKAVSGLLKAENGEVVDGYIGFQGLAIQTLDAESIVCRGISHVMEGRRVFEHLTVEENLVAGAYTRRGRGNVHADIERVYAYFPRLKDQRHRMAGYLSGGEQQMLAIGRAMMTGPRLMLLDEPSLGLAPLLAREIFQVIKRINGDEGCSILLVEHNAKNALEIADYGYIMEHGRIVLEGCVEQLLHNEDIQEFYLGFSDVGGHKSYRDVKHYKRRKRWLS